jgi:hypothetical protein
VTSGLDRFADPLKRWDTVDQRPHEVAGSDGIGPGERWRHVRLGFERKSDV